ncbi:MAG: phosphodiesterase YaeI [Sedimentisphaerales bacterium]|nr:phosphodiesterase YaeI [Sedimentisphaerales bacterium]
MPTRQMIKKAKPMGAAELNRRKLRSRRRFLKGAILGTLGFCIGAAVDALGIEPEWIEVVEQDLHLKGLPKDFTGRRLIQISDLHCSTTVTRKYLERCIRRVNHLKPDIVVLTGDYVTHDALGRFRERVTELLANLKAECGVYAVMGNHDYGIYSSWGQGGNGNVGVLINKLETAGVRVLRNAAEAVTIGEQRIWLVGLGDLWAKDVRPEIAFANVPDDEVRLLLAHNPDTVDHLNNYHYDLMLSGHTHGGQVNIPFFGPPILPVRNRRYHAGMFHITESKRLYVNRGLGRLGRVRFNCRPEITVFTLKAG